MPSGTHSPSFGELPYKLNLVSGYPFIFLPWLKQALSKDTNSWLSHRETHILLNHKPRGRCPGGCLPCWPSQHPNHFYSLLHQKPIHIWSSCFRLYHGHCCCCRVLNLVVTLDPHTLQSSSLPLFSWGDFNVHLLNNPKHWASQFLDFLIPKDHNLCNLAFEHALFLQASLSFSLTCWSTCIQLIILLC